jgi:hypothetical protein
MVSRARFRTTSRIAGHLLGTFALCAAQACGSDDGAGESGAGGTAGTGAGGNTATGGSGQTGGSGGNGTGGQGTGGVQPGNCSTVPAPQGGAVTSAVSPTDGRYTDDVDASCDGTFVVTGQSQPGISFTRKDGTSIALPTAPFWVARFDGEGFPVWAKAALLGETNGSGRKSYAASFPDGSVAVGGVFGTSATFGVGEANEVQLKAESNHPEGYIARFGVDGSLQWVQHLGPWADTHVRGIGASADNTTFAVVSTSNPDGFVLAPGMLDLKLEPGDGALVALGPDGHFLRAVPYFSPDTEEIRVAMLADGGILMSGASQDGLVLAKGTAMEQRLTMSGMFYARFTPELALDWVRAVPVPSTGYGTAPLSDGSVVFVGRTSTSLTLGAGEPHETTLTNAEGGDDGFVARFDRDGHLVWATQLAGKLEVDPYTVTALPDGSVWIAGDYGAGLVAGETAAFVVAPGTPEALTVSSDQAFRFVARFLPEGKPAWATQFRGQIFTRAISASPSTLIAAGEFDGMASFGSPDHALDSGDGRRVFIARLGP